MDDKKRSGLAVVDERGHIVGNTSASDLKLFVKNPLLANLNFPVKKFLNQIRNLDDSEHMPVFSMNAKHTLGDLIMRLGATHVHRIFVVDEQNVPQRVVSITDILRCILKHEN